ncbi:MAG: tagaturonate reductase [Pantoea sp.]|nr:tagaturonate reductase [Pantoea sp.]
MQTLNRETFPGARYPTRIIQFGEGNFLRAFIDWQIDLLNAHSDLDAGVTVVRPIDRQVDYTLNQQDGLYTALIRGLNAEGEVVSEPRLIRSINREIQPYRQFDEFIALAQDAQIRFMFSNTTEAGIAFNADDRLEDRPANSFPGKVTQLLWARWQHFSGAADKGWIILPCELIDNNGDALRELVLRYAECWQLPAAFITWVQQHNIFCNTLVDRIVPGYPAAEAEALFATLGYRDPLLVAGEVFYQFVIHGPQQVADELRLSALPLNIRLVEDIKPWKEQKVAILNGAHTAMVPVAWLSGLDTVGEAMNDKPVAEFIDAMLREEVIPTLDLPADDLHRFADAVLGRFRNPFIRHQLSAIALNSMTKFRTRLLPQLLAGYQQNGRWPTRITFALAALLAYYRGERNGKRYPLQDDAQWLDRFATLWPQQAQGAISLRQLVQAVLSDEQHWQSDLSQQPGLVDAVTQHLQNITAHGMRAALPQ